MLANPSAAASRITSTGKCSFSSHPAAWGANRSTAKRRAASWMARWSSVSSKSIRNPVCAAGSLSLADVPLPSGLAATASGQYDVPMTTSGSAAFPATRLRRLRRQSWTRRLVAENALSSSDLIWPVFIVEGQQKSEPVPSMPGVNRLSTDLAVAAAKEAADLGIPVIALFPCIDPSLKTADGREALNTSNLVCRTVRAIKDAVPDTGVLCDVALDPYTSHGHDGLLIDGDVANDETIDVLVQQALVQAEAGCDIIAPSDMMDG